MPVELLQGGPENPEKTRFGLDCEECETDAEGHPDVLVENGWNWTTAEVDGRNLGFALCPEHSTDEIIETHTNAYQDRVLKTQEAVA